MIPYATCIRFGTTQDWIVCNTTHRRVVVEKSEDGIVHVKVVECKEERPKKSLSQSEYNLLQAVDIDIDRPLTTTPFLTLYRRRDNQPVLQPWRHLMNILDDSYHGVSRCLLRQVDRWAFNTFALDVCSGGRSMPHLLVHLFHQYGFMGAFNLDVVKVWHCFNLIDAGYHSNNPYHNSVHAADVTQAMHCFLLEYKIREHMTPVEAMASLIAAVTHDLDHPGVNQPFLIATSNHLAALYKNFSVLENHHWRSAISCLRQSGIFDHLDNSVWDEVEQHIRSLILATDITRQQEFLSRFKRYLENRVLNMAEKEYRHFILQIALKCADLGNPCRPWDISHRWSLQVCKEFYRQGDYEKRLNIPVTPICDRDKTTVAKIQADFFKFVVSPLFEMWHQFLDTPLSTELLDNLHINHIQWEKLIANDETGSFETDLNAPLASEEEEGDLEDEEVLPPLLQRTATDYSWMEEPFGHWGRRRHSMPLSLPKMLPRTVIRRQSLPVPAKDTHAAPPSADDLQPTSSLLSLSSTSRGAPVHAVLHRHSRECERRLVHQPVSYPPYRRTSEPFVHDRARVCPRRSESVFAFSRYEETSAVDKAGQTEDKCENGCGTPPTTRQSGQQNSALPTAIQDYNGKKEDVLAVGTLLLQKMDAQSRLSILESASQLEGTTKSLRKSGVKSETPSWSHHVSQLAERQPEFDHPPSWKGCARLTNRRSSAPTALSSQLSSLAEKGYHRRSSMPFEHCAFLSASGMKERNTRNHPSSRFCDSLGSIPRERRHSIGFLEPFQATSEDSRPHMSSSGDETRDLFLPIISPNPLRRRRGSLPTALMVSPESEGWERRRGSTGEILSALIGLHARMPFMLAISPRYIPRSAAGLELLTGFWRSRTDWSPSIRRQANSLDSTGRLPSSCSFQRRGSLEFSLFSLSSGRDDN
ncbi:3',5'-cyclic-AMP phosphodiesterase 4A-like isoform X3 [Ornithodoros turicata]|uniref:3',5'-cyclic-AMP phosphodiesterase 4A-like isoform X3 n=1 Tax=Ornithodoros turicata TaxID=34597 RepID=UPI003139D1E4